MQAIFESSFRPWVYVSGVGAFVLLAALTSLGIPYGRRHNQGPPDPYASPGAYADIVVPRGSATSVVIGLVAVVDLIWQIWGLTILALRVIVAAVVLRSFGRNQHRTMPAEVPFEHEAWCAHVRATPAIPRQ